MIQDDDLENDQPEEVPAADALDKTIDRKHQLNDIDLQSVFVRNLDESTTEDDLREYFKDCGVIQKVTLRSDKNTGTLYAYLQFADSASVSDATLLSEGTLKGKKILVFPKRTNLRGRGRGARGGRAMRYHSRGRYMYAEPMIRGRGAYRGGPKQ